jgi:voltage-gated potassium channel
MHTENNPKHHEHVGHFQLLLVALSIYVFFALAVEATGTVSDGTRRVLDLVDSGICFLFLIDFFLRLSRSNNKLHFLRWGWIDFVSSIPALHLFRWGRVVRVVRVIRILRGVRSTKTLLEFVFQNRAKGTLASVLFVTMMLLIFSSVAILHVETDADSNIRTAGDALWWSVSTVTTVGYGDRYPTTAEGRLLGILLMTAGVATFGVFTGYIASWFHEDGNSNEVVNLQLCVDELSMEVREMKTLLRSGIVTENFDKVKASTD